MTDRRTCQQSVRDDRGTETTCDRPLPDTAMVCPRCVRRMAGTLARCVNLWAHVEAAVGRSLRLGDVPGTGTRSGRSGALHGPYCVPCDHESCQPLWKQASRNRNEAPIPHEEPLILNPDALEDAWAVENTLTTWARLLAEETGAPAPAPTRPAEPLVLAAVFITAHLDDLAHLPFAEDAFDELGHAAAQVERLVDRRAAATFAGTCDVCRRDLYAAPDDSTVTCRPCAVTYTMSAKREEMLDRLDGMLVRASEAVRILPGLGTVVTRKDIDRWATHGRLVSHGHDERGRPLYRVSEVRRMADETTRRRVAGR